jgi:hypothetical protein
MQDYEQAAHDLRAILANAGLTFDVAPAPGTDNGEKGPQRFAFVLSKGCATIRGEWQCGSAIALSAYVREPFRVEGRMRGADHLRAAQRQGPAHTNDDIAIRYRIREAYRPGVFDIVSSLLMDASTTEGYTDWLSWAEESGGLVATCAQKLRELQTTFATCRERAPLLRQMLGADHDRAADCAGRL